ncbi:hypothetical protein VPH35_024594 [Triticum aestivum]
MDNGIGSVERPKAVGNDMVACPAAFHTSSLAPTIPSAEATLGSHLARRLVEVGVSDVFAVLGDFNLTLLDHLIAEPGPRLISCCNELNAGYATDGYARAKGVGTCVVTFTAGGLSNLPVICVVGGPNSNDHSSNRILHHTIGLPDFSQELRCFQLVTCHQVVINNLDDAHEQVDKAIATALRESKPVYISVACNLPGVSHPTFFGNPIPYCIVPRQSSQMGLEAALDAMVEFLSKAVKPVMVAGPKLRVAKVATAFAELADASGYTVAMMPSAKGLVPETLPRFIGTYWGAVSTSLCVEMVESADAYLIAGPIFNDQSFVGYSFLLKKEKAVIVQPERVTIGNGPTFGCVMMKDFLSGLAKCVSMKRNTTAFDNYKRIFVPQGQPLETEPGEPLRINVLFKHIQQMLTGDSAVVAKAGDSWFNCQKLKSSLTAACMSSRCSTGPSGGPSGRC